MQNKMETQSFLWLLLLVSLSFIWLLRPFFAPIFWAVAITIIFFPVHNRWREKMPHWPNLSALLTLLVCMIIVVIPVIFTATSVINQAVDLFQRMQSGEINIEDYIAKLDGAFPTVEYWLGRLGIDMESLKQKTMDSAMSSGKFLAQHTLIIGQNAFGFVLDIALMLYVAFFLLRDGEKLLALLIRALPLGDKRERLLFTKFAEVTRATVKGNLVIAIIQGALGGIIFWILDIPGALLWAVIMSLLSLIPAVGAGLIWAPVAIYMFATGDYVQGIILVAFGIVVIGLVDNLLRPVLVGRDTKLPDYIVLLSTLGGLVIFGINGFVIGPLIAALFTVFWGIFMREFPQVDTSDNEPVEQDPTRES